MTELEKSERKYRSILESLEDGYFEVDLAGSLIFFNAALSHILGYPVSELKGMNYRTFMDSGNAEKTFQTFNRVFKTGDSVKGFDWKIVRKNGAGRYLDTSVSPVKDSRGQVVGFRGIARDVTDRRLMEKFLSESEERYRVLFDSAPVGIFHYDTKGVIRTCNQAYVDINGSSFDKLIGFNLLKNVSNQLALDAVKKSLSGTPGYFEGKYTSVTGGRTSYIKADFVPVFSGSEQLIGGMCVVENLTRRKHAETALQKSEQEAAVLLSGTNDLAVLLDAKGIIRNANEQFADRFDTTRADMIGTCVWDYFPEPNKTIRKKNFNQVLATGKTVSMEDEREGVWHYSKLCPVLDDSGNVLWVAVFAQNITEKKQAEEALRKSEEKYRSLAEHSPGIILLLDADGICRYVSPSVQRVLGYQPAEVIGSFPENFLSSPDRCRVPELMSRVIKKKTPIKFEVRVYKKDGTFAIIEWEAMPVAENDGIASIQFCGRDITARKIVEEEVKASRRQLRKLSKHLQVSREQERASIAREIHDDLGQSLTAIKLNVAWLKSKIPPDQALLIDKTEDAIKLVDSTIQTVKRISSELRPGLLDDLGLSAAIEWQAGDYQKRSGINICVAIEPEEICLDADLSIAIFRICQEALTNVIRHSGATTAWVELSRTANAVALVVRDNGIGISEKAVSEKESFGLIGMRERIHAFGGQIRIFKVPEGGTKVAVRVALD